MTSGGYPDGMCPHDLPGDDLDAEAREAEFEEEVDDEALTDLITRSAIPGEVRKAYVEHCFALPATADDSRTHWANELRRMQAPLWLATCDRMRNKLSQRSTIKE